MARPTKRELQSIPASQRDNFTNCDKRHGQVNVLSFVLCVLFTRFVVPAVSLGFDLHGQEWLSCRVAIQWYSRNSLVRMHSIYIYIYIYVRNLTLFSQQSKKSYALDSPIISRSIVKTCIWQFFIYSIS